MNNFNDMQAKAKQLVQIYHPNYTNDSSTLGACLMHTHEGDTPGAKPKVAKLKDKLQDPPNKGIHRDRIGEVIKVTITQDPDKVKIMMVITIKIILGIALVGPVVGEDEVEAENHGIIIIQMIKAKTLKGKTCKEEVEAGDVVTTHNRGNNI